MAFPVFGPVCLFFAWRIQSEDKGPVFFYQSRIGKNGEPFLCAKFRTMNEGQVTHIGFWLRSTGLDELAQVINIARGEMSVVGPRPLTPQDIDKMGWKLTDPRFRVRPGMTGLTQLHFPYLSRRSLACDRLSIQGQGFFSDVWIIIQSLMVNVIGKTRFRKARSYLFALCKKAK